jgi:tight adherence protein B
MLSLNLILFTIFISATLLILALYSYLQWMFQSAELKVSQRLKEFTKDKDLKSSDIPFVVRDDQLSQIPLLNRVLEKFHIARNLRRFIDQAGLSTKVGELLLMMLISGGLIQLTGLTLGSPILSVVLFLLGSAIPLLYVGHRRKTRLKQFTVQFPDALEMMTSALRAGHGFGRALQLVANETPDPVGTEFRKTFEEQKLGLPSRETLLNFTNRVDSVDLKLFATAVIIQRESGGDLTEVLMNISRTIRERFKLMGQIRIYTTQGRLTTWILGTLPIALALIISVFDSDYVMLLIEDPLGQMMLAAAVTLQLIGFYVIRKITHMKVQ